MIILWSFTRRQIAEDRNLNMKTSHIVYAFWCLMRTSGWRLCAS